MELGGRVALVTGGGRRVGRVLALALGRAGARVAVHYNGSTEGARETCAEIERAGGSADSFQADLADAEAPEQLVAAVVDRFGALDVLVNSAAVMERTPFGKVTADGWDAMFALNLRAPFLLAQAATPHLVARGGAIVNIADLAAFETWPAYIPHSLTKSGIVHMTRALARVLAPAVRVNAIAPGAVLLPESWDDQSAEKLEDTTPLRRLGSPEDVAGAMLYLIGADYVTGETIIVDGGRHVRR
ncbi:MAG TPA: SDR family oxidoreductase [Gemmatimonadaceae bacterium]|nr:SDR family oxidoreductase [Gemmatimonadaceae bacterium]